MNAKSHHGRQPLKYGARAKRRSLSQRIGKQGQLLFEQWANARGLVTHRCQDDFGIDYFCQVFQPISIQVEEVRGDIIGVQVKSIQGSSRPRVVLDKIDAETALRLESPYLLVGINVGEKKVYFRFLDAAFAALLATFISAPQKNLTLRVDEKDFQSTNFRQLLERNCSPGTQHRLRLRCVELCMQQELSGARLKVFHDTESGFALIEVPWLSSIFRAEPGHEEVLAHFMFERGEVPPIGTPGISLQSSIFKKVLEVAGADKLMVGGLLEKETLGFIERKGQKEPLKLRVRRAGDTWAFISESGLVLTISDRTQNDSGMFEHYLGYRLSAEFGRTLDTFQEFDVWLRLLAPGAKVGFDDNEQGMDVSAWGDALERIGDDYQQVLEAYTFASLPLSTVKLVDLADEEFAHSITFLSALARGATLPRLMPGFLLGPAASDENFQEHLERCGFEVPVVLNIKSHGIAVWITGCGRIYIDDQARICGFFPDTQSAYRLEIREQRFAKESITPEVWFNKSWPAIRLCQEWRAPKTWTLGAVNHELGGQVWPESLYDEESPL